MARYTIRELQDELRRFGHVFHTHSDTEVVLQAYLQWGHEAWRRLQGMFAIAIADLRGDVAELIIVRDRVGMKPVYVIERDGKLLFASEIKALTAWSGYRTELAVAHPRLSRLALCARAALPVEGRAQAASRTSAAVSRRPSQRAAMVDAAATANSQSR